MPTVAHCLTCPLCFVGACAYGGQVTLTTALRLVEAAPATAMSYLTVVWGILLGFIVFKEVWLPMLAV